MDGWKKGLGFTVVIFTLFALPLIIFIGSDQVGWRSLVMVCSCAFGIVISLVLRITFKNRPQTYLLTALVLSLMAIFFAMTLNDQWDQVYWDQQRIPFYLIIIGVSCCLFEYLASKKSFQQFGLSRIISSAISSIVIISIAVFLQNQLQSINMPVVFIATIPIIQSFIGLNEVLQPKKGTEFWKNGLIYGLAILVITTLVAWCAMIISGTSWVN